MFSILYDISTSFIIYMKHNSRNHNGAYVPHTSLIRPHVALNEALRTSSSEPSSIGMSWANYFETRHCILHVNDKRTYNCKVKNSEESVLHDTTKYHWRIILKRAKFQVLIYVTMDINPLQHKQFLWIPTVWFKINFLENLYPSKYKSNY
jgi:hypothetical protein